MKRITLKDMGIQKLYFDAPKAEFELDYERGIGEGGTCLVYHAYKIIHLKEKELKHKVVLKEFYPELKDADTEITRGDDGSLHFPKMVRESDSFQRKLERFQRSYELFVTMHNDEDANNSIIDADELFEANGTWYLVVDYNAACSLEEYIEKEQPELYDFTVVLKNTAEAVSVLHRKGYLHLDLSSFNILVFRNGSVRLMDSDSFLEKATIWEECPPLSWSDGYAAPELKDDDIYCDLYRVGERCDVYALGAIFYRYLFDEPLIITDYAGNVDEQKVRLLLGDFAYENKLEEKINEKYERKNRDGVYRCSNHVVRIIQKVLRGMLSDNIGHRYPGMDDVIKEIEKLLPLVNPEEIQISENFRGNKDEVFGVEKKLTELDEAFSRQGEKKRNRIVMVNGIGGIGKSTLAREYAYKHRETYQTIVEVSADNAMDALYDIPILNFKSEHFPEKLNLLRKLFDAQKSLLIIHDYNQRHDEHFGYFEELPCDIILTGWSGADEKIEMVSLKKDDLSDEAAVQIFSNAYLKDAVSVKDEIRTEKLRNILAVEKEAVIELIRKLEFHPLTLKLMGMQMSFEPGSEQKPGEALEEIERYGIKEDEYIEFRNRKDGRLEVGDAYCHLQSIYAAALGEGRLKKGELEALRYMTLLSTEPGISPARFMEWTGLGKNAPKILALLHKKGWLTYDSQEIDHLQRSLQAYEYRGVYYMPMAIAEVLYRQKNLISTAENSMPVLKNFYDIEMTNLNRNVDSYPAIKMLMDMARNLWIKINETKTMYYAGMANRCANVFMWAADQTSKMEMAYECYNKTLELCLSLEGRLSKNTINAYDSLAKWYHVMGIQDKAEMNYQEAIKTFIELGEEDSLEVSRIYGNLGDLYFEKENFEKYRFYLKKYLDISAKEEKRSLKDQVEWFTRGGNYYYHCGKIDDAIICFQEAMKCCKKGGVEYFLETDPQIAGIYLNLAKCYMDNGHRGRAYGYMMDAKRIYEKIFGESHLETASAYQAIAELYCSFGGISEAIVYAERALRIRETIVGRNHSKTAESYEKLAMIRWAKGEKEEAIALFRKSVDIQKYILGTEEHEWVAELYCFLGRMYVEFGDLEKGIRYIEKAGYIAERISPNGVYRSKIYVFFACEALKNGRKEDALMYLKKMKNIL